MSSLFFPSAMVNASRLILHSVRSSLPCLHVIEYSSHSYPHTLPRRSSHSEYRVCHSLRHYLLCLRADIARSTTQRALVGVVVLSTYQHPVYCQEAFVSGLTFGNLDLAYASQRRRVEGKPQEYRYTHRSLSRQPGGSGRHPGLDRLPITAAATASIYSTS